MALPAGQLRALCDTKRLGFRSTAELTPLDQVVGQDRALRATEFAIAMKGDGYNLFVAGPAGTGKKTTIRTVIGAAAAREPAPNDWCYVYHFGSPYRPRAIALAAGRARELRDAMLRFGDECNQRLPRALDDEEFARRDAAVTEKLATAEAPHIREIEELARREGFALLRGTDGFSVAAAPSGKPIDAAELAALPAAERERIEARGRALENLVEPVVRQLRQLERAAQAERKQLVEQVARAVAVDLLREPRRRFAGIAHVERYFDEIELDIANHAEELAPDPGNGQLPGDLDQRYRVAILVDNSGGHGAPVVSEPNPTVANLVGRVEHRIENGALVSDFTLIKPGALHAANGGYLLLDAKQLLTDESAWEVLKRALKSRSIRIEEPFEDGHALATASLQPEPIPLGAKVVLFGTSAVYDALYALDEDFRELFKVKAELDDILPRNAESELQLARFVALSCRNNGQRHFSAAAIGCLVEHAARMAGHQRRLSARFGELGELVGEAVFWAARNGHGLVEAEDFRQAIVERVRRTNLVEERLAQLFAEGMVAVDTSGSAVGQVNAVAVVASGGYEFGRPLRVTARARPAGPGVVDVLREVGQGGPSHSKGVLILSGYVAGRYVRDRPLSMTASLVAEQMYNEVEGDSASLAELLALLSAIAGVPLRQDIALTGALDQHGRVLAVGAVNEKIEGFFDLCRARGLTGRQGVIIPAGNTATLMLREDVVAAAAEGRFGVHPVSSVDEALAILAGRDAGQRDPGGNFPDGTVNADIERTLTLWSLRLRELR